MSGNPKGRPPSGLSEAERTRQILDTIDPATGIPWGERIRNVKLALAVSGNLAAIESLETRAYGKPVDTLKLEGAAQPPAGFLGIMAQLHIVPTNEAIEAFDMSAPVPLSNVGQALDGQLTDGARYTPLASGEDTPVPHTQGQPTPTNVAPRGAQVAKP